MPEEAHKINYNILHAVVKTIVLTDLWYKTELHTDIILSVSPYFLLFYFLFTYFLSFFFTLQELHKVTLPFFLFVKIEVVLF